MKHSMRSVIALIGMSTLLPVAPMVWAQTPTVLSYQGLVTAHGTNVNGTGLFKLALVNASGSSTIWSHDGTGVRGSAPASAVEVPVSNGLFTVFLGDTSLANMTEPLEAAIFQNNNLRLRIWFSDGINPFALLTPDQPLGSVGYAMMAAQVPEGAISAVQLASGAVTAAALVDNAVPAAKLDSNAVTTLKIADGAVTSNKIDWSTMPVVTLRGYKENGAFATVPVANGNNAIAMGSGASATGPHATVGGGEQNTASATHAIVNGGRANTANNSNATVGGGELNTASGWSATAGGGSGNTASGWGATVGGGYSNTASSVSTTVGGGIGNTASNWYATVGGGQGNVAGQEYATVGGGFINTAGADWSTVAGGAENEVGPLSSWGTIGGGIMNMIHSRAYAAAIAGGAGCMVDSDSVCGVIGGGNENQIGTNSWSAAIIGGDQNTIGSSARYAAIAGGRMNGIANGATNAFAAGRRAKANHAGAFVWGDVAEDDIASVANNSVTFRAAGGYRLFSNSGATLGVQLAPNATAWAVLSDRNVKENFAPIDTRDTLEKVAALPLTAWNYKADPDHRRYIGPVAQDFHAAFGLGNDTSISTLDADGVSLAAIQGMYQVVQEKEARIQKLEQDVAELRALVQQLAR